MCMGATTIIIGPRLTFWNRSLNPLVVVSSVSQRNLFRNSTRGSTTTTISCGRVTTAIRRLQFAFSRSPSSRGQYSEVSDMGAEVGKKAGVIALFDVDGTLTPARKATQNSSDVYNRTEAAGLHAKHLDVSAEMNQFMQDLRKVVTVGIVGGSDLVKISEQLGKTTIFDYDYVFSENGLVAYQDGKLIGTQSMTAHLGEEKLKKLINFVLHYIADLDIPLKRGTFIEFRMGMLNVSPIGRNCSYDERLEFEKYDKVHNIRSKFVDILKEKFADYGLTYSIGGQISFDVFPHGWDKTFCLKFIEKEFSEIHFFGDKTFKGGNDYEIFESEKTIGHTVTSPEDTRSQCTQLFL